jgi:hypothetical protein
LRNWIKSETAYINYTRKTEGYNSCSTYIIKTTPGWILRKLGCKPIYSIEKYFTNSYSIMSQSVYYYHHIGMGINHPLPSSKLYQWMIENII